MNSTHDTAAEQPLSALSTDETNPEHNYNLASTHKATAIEHVVSEETAGLALHRAATLQHLRKAPNDTKSLPLSLSPELRNLIYEELFVHEKHIVLQGEKEGLLSCSIPGIHLLETCRQVYTEAIGISYSKNVFLVKGHRERSHERMMDDVVHWLDRIASSSHYVKHLVIVHGAFLHDGQAVELRALPLLRRIWATNNTELKVSFIANPDGEEEMDDGTGQIIETDHASFDTLGTLFKIAASRVHPAWRAYSRLRNNLKHVQIIPDVNRIAFILWMVPGWGIRQTDVFEVTENGEVHRVILKHEASLQEIMRFEEIRLRVLRSLVETEGSIVYDGGKRTLSEHLPSIASVNRNIRRSVFFSIMSRVTVAFMRSTETRSTFESFMPLSEFQELSLYDQCRQNHLVLNFELEEDCDLTEIRFEGLAMRSLYLSEEEVSRVQISVQASCGYSAEPQAWSPFSLDSLNVKLLLFLLELIVGIGRASEYFTAPLQVWVDRHGRPREAEVFFGGRHVTIGHNENFDLEAEKVLMKIRERKARFEEALVLVESGERRPSGPTNLRHWPRWCRILLSRNTG